MQEAFSWRGKKGPADYDTIEAPTTAVVSDPLMEKIEGQLRDLQVCIFYNQTISL